jgi:hypothetical protein
MSIKRYLCPTAAIVALACTTGCTQDDDATRILQQAGYTDIQLTGWRPLMAGKDDDFSTGFKAKAPNGQIVTGAVTGGWLKGHTIRLD